MMRVDSVPAPRKFEEHVAAKGRKWLKGHPSSCRLPDYWNTEKLEGDELCKDALCRLYHGICAYSLFRILPKDDSQVDHFLPQSRHRDLAYDWDNFRLASSKRNGLKGERVVADPFKIPPGACHLNDKCEIVVNKAKLTDDEVKLLENTITLLRLNGDCTQDRQNARKAYFQIDQRFPQLNMAMLAADYPFVAYEILRQGLCRNTDDEDVCRNTLHSIGFSWV